MARAMDANTFDTFERHTILLCSRINHSDVLLYCRAALLDQNYFHAAFEATKSIATKVRALIWA